MIRILHVDDEVGFLDLVGFFLKREGDFEVETTTTAESALEKMESEDYDAIVVDFSLPGMDGIELLKIVRAKGLRIPYVLFTGKGKEETAVEALNSGADFYLQKGASPQLQFKELANMLRKSVQVSRSEAAARQGDRFLSSVFSSIQDGISVLDKEMNILRVNQTMEAWYSHKMPLVGKKCYNAYHGRNAQCDSCPSARTVESGKSDYEVVPKIGPKGEVVGWLDLYSFPLRDSMTGELSGVIEYLRDITDRRKAEDALRESDIRLKKLSYHVPGMIYQFVKRLDGSYCIPFTTEAIKEIFGCSPEDVRDDFSPIAKVILPEDFDKVVGSIEYSGNHLTLWQCEYRVQVPGRPIRWLYGQSTPEKMADGSIVWHGFNTDITERKLAEEMLRASEEKYRHLVDLAQEGILMNDADAVIRFVNPKMAEMLGYHVDEIVGKTAFLFMNEQSAELAGRKLEERRRGLKGRYELDFVRKDGTLLRASLGVAPIKDKDGGFAGSLAVITDMTDRKRYEEALELANQKLNLLGQVTRHDALNQLAILMGWLQIAQEVVTEPPLPEYLMNVRTAAETVIRQLDFAGDYQKMGIAKPEWVDVKTAFLNSTAGLGQGKITRSANVEGLEIYADMMFEKVFHNLADNSIRHGKKVTEIRLDHKKVGKDLLLIYEDNGIGIPVDEKVNLFKRGAGAHTGFGLFIARAILGITGITIEENGNPGHGVRFEMHVPSNGFRFKGGVEH